MIFIKLPGSKCSMPSFTFTKIGNHSSVLYLLRSFANFINSVMSFT